LQSVIEVVVVSNCKALKIRYCDENKMTELDVSKNTLFIGSVQEAENERIEPY